MLSLGLSLTAVPILGQIWSPAALFSGGWSGLWLDPSHLPSLSQDAAGSVPVTAPGQPVGLIRDRSGLGRHAAQAVASARPTYRVDAGGRPCLEFDGIDDWLGTASLTLATGGRTIVSALRKRGAIAGAVVESRPAWTDVPGGIAQYAPSPADSDSYGTRVLTSAAQSLVNTPAAYPPPHGAVLTSLISAGSHVARVNGTVAASASPSGAIPALSAALGVGSRDGTSLFSTIDLYGLIVINRVLPPAELARAEAWAAARAGVTLA